MQKFQNDFMGAAVAVRDHFGDTEPTEEEIEVVELMDCPLGADLELVEFAVEI